MAPVFSILLYQLSNAFKNRFYILSCLLDVAVSGVIQHVLWTILLETEQFPGVLRVTLMWHVVGFISLVFVFVDVSVFLLLFLALLVPSHLPWV